MGKRACREGAKNGKSFSYHLGGSIRWMFLVVACFAKGTSCEVMAVIFIPYISDGNFYRKIEKKNTKNDFLTTFMEGF